MGARAARCSRSTTIDHALVTELIVEDGRVSRRRVLRRRRDVAARCAPRATLLATGGAGQVFRETTNPAVATGDGVALAYHAGARVADLEFVQFHPTALNVPGAPRFLISEALRGEGARLVNARGEPFMTALPPGRRSGAARRRRAQHRARVERTGGPGLPDARAPRSGLRAAAVSDHCRDVPAASASISRAIRFRSGPAAHYIMGGVDTDEWGRTSLPGLFAAGEVACTGVHGANRLASNSLLEGLVFGARAAVAMQADRRQLR